VLPPSSISGRPSLRWSQDRIRSWDHRKLGLPEMELGGSTAAFVE